MTESFRRAHARRWAALACALALAACGGRAAAPAAGPAPVPTAVAPMDLGGQRVLILPVQASNGLAFNREQITEEIVGALTGRDTRTQWVAPERLRRLLRQSPTLAADPAGLPPGPWMVDGVRRIGGPLADVVRRYMALTEARLVVIPRSAVLVQDSTGSRLRLNAAVVDARSGMLVWWGEADGRPAPAEDPALVSTAAAALAARMVVPDSR
ncbi:MAG TPA: hypothetical protein VF665_09375 [Longimicrobium sp.]|jgi:hypothetical protein|uniref:hypothetical protein n=1 Tax=Longimicrobium sp. TaxID=2029185 RepID=UPI002ED7C188